MKKLKYIILIILVVFITACDSENTVKEKKDKNENKIDIKEYYEIESSVKESAKLYIQNYNNLKNEKIELNTLINEGYIKKKDLKVDNQYCDGYVIATVSSNDACIEVYIKCDDYKTNSYGTEEIIGSCELNETEFQIEDYIGKNYLEVKNMLELNGYNVIILKQQTNGYDGEIISQNVEDKTIFLTINSSNVYPNFLEDGYRLEDIYGFANTFNINLQITNEKNDNYSSGDIINQSINPGEKVIEGQMLKITVAE